MFYELMWEVIVRFVEIGGIDSINIWTFLFIIL
jgi:hypothetical protein